MRIVGSLLSVPYIILFFGVWIVASISRPLAVASLLCVISNPIAGLRKLQLLLATIQYLIFCNDKSWKAPKEDPDSYFHQETDGDSADQKNIVERKTVIFVRHGESTWNDTFNKGGRPLIGFILNFIPNLCLAIFYEWYWWVSGQSNESWFYDSPLSEKGLAQALAIRGFLSNTSLDYVTPKEAALIRILDGDKVSSQLVSSNLRRAISTMIVGFQDRLEKRHEKDDILILSCLQEISRNPDALCITPAHGDVLPAAWTDPKPLHAYYKGRCDTRWHTGNKPVSSNGLLRLQSFCASAFEDIDKESIIVAGHSLWFRSFFQTYLPHGFDHISKKKKLCNGGIVGFTLERTKTKNEKGENSLAYRIDPKSIMVLHGGF